MDFDRELVGTVNGKVVRVPIPLVPEEARIAATRVFSNKVFPFQSWMENEYQALSHAMEERLLLVASIENGEISLKGKELSTELKGWISTELAVYQSLHDAYMDGHVQTSPQK